MPGPSLTAAAQPATAYGASADDAAAAAGLLRAHLHRTGRPLAGMPAADDLVGAVVSAHLWSVVTGTSTLSAADRGGSDARRVLHAALQRAGGFRRSRLQQIAVADVDRAVPLPLVPAVVDAADWARRHADDHGSALAAAAADLACGGSAPWRPLAAALLAADV